MANFTKSIYSFNGTDYNRYAEDRKRGGASWVFYNIAPPDTIYAVTWPEQIQNDVTLGDKSFASRLQGDNLYVDFVSALTTAEETQLGTLYDTHVAPVPS